MINDNRQRNVAIYARVSTEHEAQIYALENQVDWYDLILKSHPNWNIVNKYIDKGITGTSATKRPQFLKMINDSEDGLFDLIITREVSRFARNTVDTLQYTRKLKKLGVEVYFVEDNICTFDADGELRLTIMATLAQDESRKISLRVKAGQRASMEKGVFFQNGSILGYDKVGNEMVINEEQAETVRLIFRLYNSGMGVRKIQWELESRGYKTARGSDKWSASVISRIIKNKFYAGYIVWYKQYVPDFLEQKKINNHGEKEKFEVQGTHEPLVTLEEWEMAQSRMAKARVNNGNQKTTKQGLDVWCRKLKCSCGHSFNRKQWHKDLNNGKQYYGYQCYNSIKTGTIKTRLKKGLPIDGICTSPTISGWKLDAMALFIFSKLTIDKEEIINIATNELKKHIKNKQDNDNEARIESIKKNIDKYNNKIENLIDMRTENEITKEQFAIKKVEFENEVSRLESELNELQAKCGEEVLDVSQRIDLLIDCVRQLLEYPVDNKIPDYIIDAVVEQIIVDGNTIKWKLRYIPDEIDITLDSVKKNKNIMYVCPHFAKCGTGFHKRNTEINYKLCEFIFDKKLAIIYMHKKPKERILNWSDFNIEIYI